VPYVAHLELALSERDQPASLHCCPSESPETRTCYDYRATRKDTRCAQSSSRDTAIKINVTDACFVAGTLVHTRDGLVPIEQINVGDWVLSKPEGGEGELAYKRVANTLVFREQEVRILVIYPKSEQIRAIQERGFIKTTTERVFVATSAQSFWVNEIGWTPVDYVSWGDELEMSNGESSLLSENCLVIRTSTEDIGWYLFADETDRSEGTLIDFRNGKPEVDFNAERVPNDGVNWDHDCYQLRRTAYNLEVEEYHTYYVGDMVEGSQVGLWVRDGGPRREGSLLNLNEAAMSLETTPGDVEARIERKSLLSWRISGRPVVPAEQIFGRLRVVAGIRELLEIIPEPAMAWNFLTQESAFLDPPQRPIDALKAGKIAEVIAAAQSYDGTTTT